MSKSTSIRVVCRFRPLNSLEKGMGGETCVELDGNTICLNQAEKGDKVTRFAFDHVFGQDTTQPGFFEVVGRPILERTIYRAYCRCNERLQRHHLCLRANGFR